MGNVDIKEVLDIRSFNLDSVLELDPDFLKEAHEEGEHHHHHEDGCTCAATTMIIMITMITASAEIMITIIANAVTTIIMHAMMTKSPLSYSSPTDRLTRPDSTTI